MYYGEGNSRPYIMVGDKTSKGGEVISGSAIGSFKGKPIARTGDIVTCPCNACRPRGGKTKISFGSSDSKLDGRSIARDGDMTECGAILISGQAHSFDSATAAGQAAFDLHKKKYDRYFLIVNAKTKAALPNTGYRIRLSDGRIFVGTTDKNGHTELVSSDSPISANIEAPFYGDNPSDTASATHASRGSDACSC